MKTKTIRLSDIVIDAGTQQREKINDDVVSEYSEFVKCGDKFPPITVFFNGIDYYLADGFHRYFAHKHADIEEIEADIFEGTKRDAKFYSLGANKSHGLRRSNQDKKKAVLEMITDEEWGEFPSRDIGNHIGVSHAYVNKMRRELEENSKENLGNVSKKPPKPALNRDNDKKLSTGEPLEKPLDDQSSGIDNDAHNEFNQFSEEQIAEEMASEIDVEKELYNAHMEIERLTKIIESDDKLSEIKRLSDLVQHWEEKSNGYQVAVFNKNEDLKKWKRRAEKLERELKNAGMVEF